MQSYRIYKNLAWLNGLPKEDAEAILLDCCGSRKWASRMADHRPFPMLEDLYTSASALWYALTPVDRLEAFSAHPKIGSNNGAAKSTRSTQWSAGEQKGVNEADAKLRKRLDEANRLYEHKFGFIFIICATGRTAEEMLAECESRLQNSVTTELQIASREQEKITELRLNKLLEK